MCISVYHNFLVTDHSTTLYPPNSEVNGDTLRRALRGITVKRESNAVVVLLGSALKNKGVQPLMDAVAWVGIRMYVCVYICVWLYVCIYICICSRAAGVCAEE